MKKLIIIFGVFAIICVLVSYSADRRVSGLGADTGQIAAPSSEPQEIYTVKSSNGRIVVYKGDELILKTSTAVSTLPKKDEKALLYGITVYSMDEVNSILNDYCS